MALSQKKIINRFLYLNYFLVLYSDIQSKKNLIFVLIFVYLKKCQKICKILNKVKNIILKNFLTKIYFAYTASTSVTKIV